MKILTIASFVTAFVMASARPVHATSIACGIGSSTLDAPCTFSLLNVLSDLEHVATSLSDPVTDSWVSSSFGSNRFVLNNRSGRSQFNDTFTVTGGSGSGTAIFFWSLTGTMSQDAPLPGCSPFWDGANVQFSRVSEPAFAGGLYFNAMAACSAGTSIVDRSGSFSVDFIYDVPFVQGLTLSGGPSFGRNVQLDFSSTGLFTSIVLPDGAEVLTGSGTTYPITSASPVPEPTSLILLGTGLVATRRYHRWRRS